MSRLCIFVSQIGDIPLEIQFEPTLNRKMKINGLTVKTLTTIVNGLVEKINVLGQYYLHIIRAFLQRSIKGRKMHDQLNCMCEPEFKFSLESTFQRLNYLS